MSKAKVDSQAVAQRLRERRQALKLSQAELARLARVHPQSISNYENGRIPKADELLKISAALQTTAQEILTGEGGRHYFGSEIKLAREASRDELARSLQNANVQPECLEDPKFVEAIDYVISIFLSRNEKLRECTAMILKALAAEPERNQMWNAISVRNALEASVRKEDKEGQGVKSKTTMESKK